MHRLFQKGVDVQTALANKLLVANGAALGLLATLSGQKSSSFEAADYIFPVICFVLAMAFTFFGLWTRANAFFEQSKFHVNELDQLVFDMAESRSKHLGEINNSGFDVRPKQDAKPSYWFNALDILSFASALLFLMGVVMVIFTLAD